MAKQYGGDEVIPNALNKNVHYLDLIISQGQQLPWGAQNGVLPELELYFDRRGCTDAMPTNYFLF